MVISQLTSRNNPLFKTIRLVSSGSRGAPRDLVVAEGIRVLEEVHRCNSQIKAVIVSEGFGASCREEDLLKDWISRNVRICRTESKLFRSLSDVRTPQGVVALVRVPPLSLDQAPPAPRALIVLACGIQDPGNLGTLIRTAAAAGGSLLCTSKGTVSARKPKAIRASAGAFFHLPIVEQTEIPEFMNYCKRHQIRVLRTDTHEGLPHTEADLASPCAILFGNEGSGIASEGVAGIAAIHIPMAQGVESLNVAMAGAVLLFEAARQRAKQP
jgi:TrmH family RNA methyltransferase